MTLWAGILTVVLARAADFRVFLCHPKRETNEGCRERPLILH